MSNVFRISFHITPTERAAMPVGTGGACVCCYSGVSDLERAIRKATVKLSRDGMFAERVLEPIHQIDSSQWVVHINDQWPEHVCSLHTQEEFELAMDNGEIVYGPIGVYQA